MNGLEGTYASCSSVGHADNEGKEKEPPGLDILHGLDELIAVPLLGLCRSLELLGTEGCELALGGRQERGTRGRVWEEEVKEDGPRDCDETKDEEEHLSGLARYQLELRNLTDLPLRKMSFIAENAIRNHGTNNTRRGISSKPERVARDVFVRRIPHSRDERESRANGAFKNTEKQSKNHQACVI